MNLILTCLGPLDLTFSDNELLLTETDLTEQTESGQLNAFMLLKAFVLFTSFVQTESGCFGYSYQKIEAKLTIFLQ